MTGAAPGTAAGGRSRDLRRPPIAEITALARERAARGHEIIDLGQAVLGLAPPPAALQRVREYLNDTAVHVYAPDPGLPEAREAVAALWREDKGVPEARAAQVMLTCGANQAFVNALLTLSRPGDEVITFGPGYFDHEFAIRLAGCTPVEVPLRLTGSREQPATGFDFDVAAVAAALTPRTRAVVLVSPGNPTGAVIPEAQRRQLGRLCAERGLWLISDETYDGLTFPPARHASPLTDPEADPDRVVALGSFSKIFGLAAWRVGYLLASAAFIEEAIKAQDALVVCAPVPAQQAAIGALSQRAAYLPQARETLRRRRDRLLERLAEHPALAPTGPDGGTFVLARLTPTPGDHTETTAPRETESTPADDVAFCKALVRRAGVITVPGSAFGPRGAGWVRLSYGNQPTARIDRACDRLLEATDGGALSDSLRR
jgi:aspartate/methionine/tyrosine aminotransferase